MFEQLVNETATRFDLSDRSASSLMRGVLSLITNERTGGAEGFVDLFRRAGLGDVITSWFGGKEGRPITASNLESALGTSTLDRLAGSSGLTYATVSAVLGFMLPKLIGLLTPAGSLPSSSSLSSEASRYINQQESPQEHRTEYQAPRRTWRWWPWAAAAAFAVFVLLWMRAPGATIDPQLTLSNTDGKITYSGIVRDEATRNAIVNSLRRTFGENNVNGDLRIDRRVKPATWQPRLGEFFLAAQTPGVELALNGNTIGIGGWLSAADRQSLTGRLRGIFGPQAAVSSLGDPAADAIRKANDKAISALGTIGTSGVSSTNSVVDAMNLAVINFASGSAQVPSDSLVIIEKSAEAIKRAPSGSIIEIRGHTDSTGDPTVNLTLSQARADAVKAALVNAGVPGSMLITRGYGDTVPRATNGTEFGRFQNRRIEYAIVQ